MTHARGRPWLPVAPGKVIFYGIEKPAEYQAEEIEDRGALGSRIHARTQGEAHAD